MKAIVTMNFEDEKYSLREFYTDILNYHNITPIGLINDDYNNVQKYVQMADIVVITGGGDISPTFYDEHIDENFIKSIELVSYNRDKFEIELVKEAIRQNKKILGICRGVQVINVACGGTLIQHITGHMNTTHNVVLNKNSVMNDTKHNKVIEVNSIHHQVIDRLGKGLYVTALSEDNYIEAIENGSNILAVQWHIERLPEQYSCISEFINK